MTGSPTEILWTLSKPLNSGIACSLDDPTSLRPLISPDVEGIYVLSCLVDGATTYTLTISIANVSVVSVISAIHLLPARNSQIPTPRSGGIIFFSSDSDSLSIKFNDDSVEEIQST